MENEIQEKEALQAKLEKPDRNALKWEQIVDTLKSQLADEKSEHEELQNNFESFKNDCIAKMKENKHILIAKDKEILKYQSKINFMQDSIYQQNDQIQSLLSANNEFSEADQFREDHIEQLQEQITIHE